MDFLDKLVSITKASTVKISFQLDESPNVSKGSQLTAMVWYVVRSMPLNISCFVHLWNHLLILISWSKPFLANMIFICK